ncbi:MAG: GNAT family N-acetyltransferase [Anaerolineae bacterium]|nr:GNAT family N-acetyltransferase [Anaerolineae bacterium]
MKITTRDENHYHIRELWLDDETLACNLSVVALSQRIGIAQVRMAGIGGVHTERQYRKKGYMRQLFEDTLAYMLAEGYDISQLFGIDNFYIKWGYTSCLGDYRCVLKTRDAEAVAPLAKTYPTRTITAADMPAILDLYHTNNAVRTCSIIRTLETFPEFRKGTWWFGDPPETLLWEDATGHLLAYMVWDRYDKEVKVAEVEAVDPALYPTLLYTLAVQAIAKRCEDIKLYIPPDHPFAELAQRYGVEWAITYPRYGGGMMRILNQRVLFEKLGAELERRLSCSSLAGYTGELTLKTDLDITHLSFNEGHLTVKVTASTVDSLELSQDILMQLIVGYRSARDVLNTPGVITKGMPLPLLHALFPRQYAYTWTPDHF